jgi:predicted dehydrogenase
VSFDAAKHMDGTALRIGVVGCGYWGMNYVRIFNELPHASVVAVCEKRLDRLEEVVRRGPGVHLTTELDELLESDVDAVVICTEATTHYTIARQCLLAGKHVLVEKPITTAVEQAEELSRLAQVCSKVLMVGHTFVYNAGVRKVKECIRRDQSRIYYLHACRTNLGPIRHDVNALWDLATHDIAIFNYLLDNLPEWVSAIGVKVLRNCREDVGFITLGYQDGIVGHIHVSWADPNKAREVVVVCSDKRVVFDDLNALEQVRIYEKGIRPADDEPLNYGEHRLQIRDGDILSPKIPISEPLKEQCRHFLECCKDGHRPLTSGEEGADVLRVLAAVDESVMAKGARIEVTRNGSPSYTPA